MEKDNPTLLVPHVTRKMLEADFWLERIDDATTVHDIVQIHDTLALSQHLAKLEVIADDFSDPLRWAEEILPVPDGYREDGTAFGPRDRDMVAYNANVRAVTERLGFCVQRAPIGAWPTANKIFRSVSDREFDHVRQTVLHTFEPVLILGESQDQRWYLVQSRTYQGWIEKRHIAWCERTRWDLYRDPIDPLVVIGRGVTVEPDPYSVDPSPLPVEFGAWLPQSSQQRLPEGRQAAIWHYVVDLPFRRSDGQLVIEARLISRTTAVTLGFLPATREALLRSAFSLLGDRYGWGDSFGRHDCSSFIMDVYRTIGVQLPRNSKAQSLACGERVSLAQNWKHALTYAKAGDELYMPGHVMLYLGSYEGHDYAIHAFVGYSEGPGTRPVIANQVMVTSLEVYLRSGDKRYGDALTSVHAILP